jgi:hypothetical protein
MTLTITQKSGKTHTVYADDEDYEKLSIYSWCVYKSDKGKPWYCVARINGKKHYVGAFPTATEAARAYDSKAKELIGTFTWLNFPEGTSH